MLGEETFITGQQYSYFILAEDFFHYFHSDGEQRAAMVENISVCI